MDDDGLAGWAQPTFETGYCGPPLAKLAGESVKIFPHNGPTNTVLGTAGPSPFSPTTHAQPSGSGSGYASSLHHLKKYLPRVVNELPTQ